MITDILSLFETVVHYLIIGGITYLSHRGGFPMVSIFVHVIRIRFDLW